MHETRFHRLLGGSPLAVLVRLTLMSLLVGALMSWLDIDAMRLFVWIERSVSRLWGMGFDAVRQLGRYLVAGAVLVLPVWLVTRLFSIGDSRQTYRARWPFPGGPGEVSTPPGEIRSNR